ncbi:MAG TPA: ABC transporter permease, partial [Myxococcales bacterium]|nr:ABC transporter permease [Myxococcales bacterium]
METFLKDFRLAARALRKAPAFTAVSLGVLALGIGANSVMFGVVDTVLLRPLAYRDPHRLMAIETVQQDTNTPISNSPPEFYRLRDESRAFETVAGLYRRPVNLTGAHEPERVRAIVVSADLLSLLGAAPVLGRGFARDDERWGSHRVALIGSSLWRTRFGADPAVIGRTVGLDGQPYTIVGVLPPGFSWLGYEAELLLPMSFEPGDNMNSHNNYFMAIVARLRRGATQEQGRREVSALGSSVAKEFPESRGLGMRAVPMDEWMTGEVRPAILVLLGAVSLVLLIACANVANLFLVRAAARGREIAIRSALGASRGRLLRQLLTESVLLSALGGVLGLVLAFWGTEALNGLDHNVLPRMRDVTIDVRVLAFTAGVSLLTGILFGLVPALQGSATPLRESLTEAAPTMQGGRRRLTAALVVAEVALSLVLLAGAGLLVKSTYRLLRVDLGFDPRDVLTAEIHLPAQKYLDAELARRFSPASTAKAAHFYDDVIARLRSLPGVRAVGAISGVPFGGNFWGKRAVFHDRPLPATSNELPEILYQVVAGDYFG